VESGDTTVNKDYLDGIVTVEREMGVARSSTDRFMVGTWCVWMDEMGWMEGKKRNRLRL
jgi:hypothetical protein